MEAECNRRIGKASVAAENEFMRSLKKYGVQYDPAHVLGQVGRPSGTWVFGSPTQDFRPGLSWFVPSGLISTAARQLTLAVVPYGVLCESATAL